MKNDFRIRRHSSEDYAEFLELLCLKYLQMIHFLWLTFSKSILLLMDHQSFVQQVFFLYIKNLHVKHKKYSHQVYI